ncbi:MAG: CBS domain-containing protein [Nitrosopumilaceae archaeon]
MEQSVICVKDIMTSQVISVDSSVSVNDAAKMMENSEVGAIIVMEGEEPRGIITDRDFAIKIAAHAYPIDTPVRRVMSFPLITIGPEEPISVAADLMSTRKIRKLPVVDEDKIIGIVTATDLVNHQFHS